MVGELDTSMVGESYENFTDYFKFENMYHTAIFICFVFMMCIIILSLFEGIAVGEIKDVLDKAHIEIISNNIFYILKIQSILYSIYMKFNRKNQIPTFMNITEFKLVNTNVKIFKTTSKKINLVKKIDNDLTEMSIKLNSISGHINELTKQIRMIKQN